MGVCDISVQRGPFSGNYIVVNRYHRVSCRLNIEPVCKIAGCDGFCQSQIFVRVGERHEGDSQSGRLERIRGCERLAQVAEAGLKDAQCGDGGCFSPQDRWPKCHGCDS